MHYLGYILKGAYDSAVAVTYLLNHPFTNADTGAIADSAAIAGATTGVLNAHDTSTGQVEVLSNAGKVTPTAPPAGHIRIELPVLFGCDLQCNACCCYLGCCDPYRGPYRCDGWR